MAVRRQRTYTHSEVDRIVRASENRASIASGARGHTGERHVLITNDDLEQRGVDRARVPSVTIPIACAFASLPDAVTAVTAALNSATGQQALGFLDGSGRSGQRAKLEAMISPPVRVRYSSCGVTRRASTDCATIILERIEDPASFGLHVQTAYPTLWLTQGSPTWRDAD
jgi:hypothetical protein